MHCSETISFKNILRILLRLIEKRALIPIPLFIAKANAAFFEIFPKTLIN